MRAGPAIRPPAPRPPSPPATPGQNPPPRPDFSRMFSAFEDVMVKDLIPMIDATYRTIPDREHRAMAGLSMGGMQTFQITLKHLDLFAYIGGFSGGGGGFGGVAFDPKTAHGGVMADADAFNKKVHVLWLGIGTTEPQRMYEGIKNYHEALEKAGIKHVYYESPGTSHEWLTWRRCLHEFAPLLFADTHPSARRPGRGAAAADRAERRRRARVPRAALRVRRGAHGRPAREAGDDLLRIQVRRHDAQDAGLHAAGLLRRRRSTRCCTCCTASAATRRNGSGSPRPNLLLDNLIADGKAAPMIVVMPNGRAQKNDRAEGNIFAAAPAFAAFEKDLLEGRDPRDRVDATRCRPTASTAPSPACRWAAASRSTSGWLTSTPSPGSAASPRPRTRSRPAT